MCKNSSLLSCIGCTLLFSLSLGVPAKASTLWQNDSTQLPKVDSPLRDTLDQADELGPSGRVLTGISLPPLAELYANAENVPFVQTRQKQKEFEALQLKREKRNFLSFFNANGSYYYGNNVISNRMYDDSGAPIPLDYSQQLQSRYNIGASISIPLDKLFDLRGSVRRQQKVVERAEMEFQAAIEERKVTIASLYAKIVSFIPIVKAATEKMIFANAQYALSENDFVNGQITASEISVEKSRQMQALSEYENARSELYGLLLQLELVSHTQIISANDAM